MANAREMLDDVDNVGIMQGFLDEMEDDMGEEEDGEEENSAAKMLDRRPDSPEILMNNLRGDMRSVDARREELADLVGYAAAAETPDSVLAMLQPVLAQGGGLGALPQSMPMAQGPQAPMPPGPQMPPPPGPMAPPPTGAPPMMPPEAMMPPQPQDGGIAALLAGGAPGGGQAPPQAPIGMKDGGYIQHFKLGSDEEAVAPVGEDETASDEEDSSSRIQVTPDMLALARQGYMNLLASKPAKKRDLRTLTAEREELYRELLGEDKDMRQAQLLLMLGQKGLQLAGNVDAQGRPLRGSTMSRLATVASEVPGAVSQFISDTDKRQNAIRMAAIQAAEKEIQQDREAELAQTESARKAFGDVLRSAGRASSSVFGKGGMGPFFDALLSPGAARAYADGEMTPDEQNFFEFAYNRVVADSRPRVEIYKDELGKDQKNIILGYEIPSFLTDAVAQRRQLDALGPRPAVDQTTRTVPAGPGVVAELNRASVQAADTAEGTGTQSGAPRQLTLWEMAPSLSFIDVAAGNIARNVPFTGKLAEEAQVNQNYYNNQVAELIRIMQNSPRFAEGERESIEKRLDMGLKVRRDANALRNIFKGVDQFLAEKLEQAKIDYANKELVPEIRKSAQDDIRSITAFRAKLMPVQVYSLDELRSLPPGTPFFYKNERTEAGDRAIRVKQ